MNRTIDMDSKTNRLRRELLAFPSGATLTRSELQDLADRIGVSVAYARLVVNGSGRHVRLEAAK